MCAFNDKRKGILQACRRGILIPRGLLLVSVVSFGNNDERPLRLNSSLTKCLFASLQRTNYKVSYCGRFPINRLDHPKGFDFHVCALIISKSRLHRSVPAMRLQTKKQPRGECFELQDKPMHFDMYLFQSLRERLRAVSQSQVTRISSD